jgi:hypothetical protein
MALVQIALELGRLPSELEHQITYHQLAEIIAFKNLEFAAKYPHAAPKKQKQLNTQQAIDFVNQLRSSLNE